MVMLVTENELLSAAITPEGRLTFTRENGDIIDAGVAVGPAVTDAGMAANIGTGGAFDTVLNAAIGEAAEDSIKVAANGVSLARLPGTLRGTRRYNASSFTQDPIQTLADGTQFAVWVDTDSKPIIGKRKFPYAEWETFDLSTISGNPFATPVADDSHNSFSMIVDSDGYIHVAGNHHMDPLKYARSVDPLDITSWVTPGMIGDEPEQTLAYPQFAKLPNGDLIFTFRDEGPVGLGAYHLNHYSVVTKTWTRRAKLLDGTTVTPTQSPYLNKLAIGQDGSIHLFFLWRQGIDPKSSTQISHMKSDDSGVTWKTAGGVALSLPVLYSNSAPVITASLVGELNQSGAAVDSAGNPWSVWWRSLGALNGGWGVYVRRWNGSTWVQEYILNTGDRRWAGVDISQFPRPQVFNWQGRMFLLYVREPDATGLRIREVTPGAVNPLPDMTLISGALGRYEPVFDLSAIAERSELHVLVTPTRDGVASANPSYANVWGGVLSVDLATLRPQVAPAETLFIAPTQMIPAASTGVGTIAIVNSTPVAKVTDDAQTTAFMLQQQIPAHWSTFRVGVLWMPLGATPSGGVAAFRAQIRWNVSGEATGLGESIQYAATGSAGAQHVAVETVFDMAINNPPGGKWVVTMELNRWGGVAADTLAGGLGILGVMLTRV